jgi:SAM-dependent methyltransferase
MVHHNECPLCGSVNIKEKLICKDHLVSGEIFKIISCNSCCFVFTQDYPEEKDIGKYYESEDYISHSDTSKGLTNKLYQVVRRIMLKRKKRLVRRITGLSEGTLLDIGSGTGYFASVMKNSGWDIKGIEINDHAREFSRNHFNLEVLPPDDIKGLKSNFFDCITLWHVMEHFHDPFKYVNEIKRLLKREGKCIIALPNCGSYDADSYGPQWAGYDVPRHLWHFTPESFRFLCNKTGLKLISENPLPLDVFYISQLSEKYMGSSAPFIKGMLKATLFAFHAWFIKKKTSSLIYIVEKAEKQE